MTTQIEIVPAPSGAPASPDALHEWIRDAAGVSLSRTPMLGGHDAPFDYISHAFFEGSAGAAEPAAPPPEDCVVWANRGGGKTFLGAVATMLDLVFKAGVEVRILAGSLEQARRMHAHLRNLFARPALEPLLDGRITDRRVRLINGSCAELLACSQTSVRGTRVQKLRCDEVELFPRDLWDAAQLTTRSMRLPGPWGEWVHGGVEALSTMHRPFGLMWDLVDASSREPEAGAKRRLFRWGVLDVLDRCGDEHACDSCSLSDECKGRAKGRSAGTGHIRVADALQLKSRIGVAGWEAEMLCLRPSRSDAVYPEFDPARHVVDRAPAPDPERDGDDGGRRWLAAMDFGFRAPTVILFACLDEAGVLWIVDERIATETILKRHIDRILDSPWPRPSFVAVDPAGRQREHQTGESAMQVLVRAGLAPRARRSGVHEGVMRVRARLAPADRSGARLLIHRRCRRLIEAMSRYHYDRERPWSLDPVKDGQDHAPDALRYLVVNVDAGAADQRGRYS